MNKTVFLFSGQGSQKPGMGIDLISRSTQAKRVFECASDIVGFDLAKVCETATEEELAKTEISQPAIMATSLAAHACAKESGIEAQACAGHSLGEYAALVVCGVLSMEDGFRVIKARAKAMSNCARQGSGVMFAVMGTDNTIIQEVCDSIDGYVLLVNYNSRSQTIIAGEESAVMQAVDQFTKMGKRTIKLAVSAAFHTKYMQPAADELKDAVSSIAFHEPSIDFYSNITGGLYTDFSNMPSYLAKHMVSPVQFVQQLYTLQKDGYSIFIELGPKVLTPFVKRTLKGVIFRNIRHGKSLQKTLDAIQL